MSIAGDYPCKICLMDTPLKDMITLQQCGCIFCKEVRQLISFTKFFSDITISISRPISHNIKERCAQLPYLTLCSAWCST